MKVFVYGTLMSGYGNNRLLRSSTFVNKHTVQDYKLYYAGFPVATHSEGDQISGEIWDIGEDSDVIRSLDRLESEGFMYNRVEIEPGLWMYVGNSQFWNNFSHREECLKDESGVYYWSR